MTHAMSAPSMLLGKEYMNESNHIKMREVIRPCRYETVQLKDVL